MITIDRDLSGEVTLDSSIQFEGGMAARYPHGQSVFLTGVTGFLGVNLLHTLLNSTTANIFCLVRTINITEGMAKIRKALAIHQIWKEEFSSRIYPIVGDLSRPRFGLTEDAFQHLGNQIEVIYHSGSWVNFIYPFDLLKAVNVKGTEEILRLSAVCPLVPVHYVSSLSIFNSEYYANMNHIQESFEVSECSRLESGYSQSKWVGEKLIKIAADRGAPTWIYRPGYISGHSKTGVSNIRDRFSMLLWTCMQMQVAPEFDGVVHLTPVDYVSRMMVALSRAKIDKNKAFHLINPRPVSWIQVLDVLKREGYVHEFAPYNLWLEKARTFGQRFPKKGIGPLIMLLSGKFPFQKNKRRSFECRNAMEALKGVLDVQTFDNNDVLLQKYFNFLQSVSHL